MILFGVSCVTDRDEATVFVIVGRAWDNEEGTPETAIPVNIFLTAPDDDSAVRRALEALKAEGYAEAELDQIGMIMDEPDEPLFEAAYQDALEGDVAVVAFRS